MKSRVVQVNVGKAEPLAQANGTIQSAIHKRAVATAVTVGKLGLEGDVQVDKRYHGGEDKAVYALGTEQYDHWRRELARPELPLGIMGENLSVEGLDESRIHLGDRFEIGTVVLEVTEPRLPCRTLAAKMDLPNFVTRFAAHEGSGVYFRVAREGTLKVGDVLERIHTDPTSPTVLADFRRRLSRE